MDSIIDEFSRAGDTIIENADPSKRDELDLKFAYCLSRLKMEKRRSDNSTPPEKKSAQSHDTLGVIIPVILVIIIIILVYQLLKKTPP